MSQQYYTSNRTMRILVLFCSLLSLTLYLQPLNQLQQIPQSDMIQYFSAAKLFLQDKNPYDPILLYREQQTTGIANATPLIMYNPALILFWIWPLGLLSFSLTKSIWLGCSISSLVLCLWQWSAFFGFLKKVSLPTSIAISLIFLSFLPIYSTIYLGQISWLHFIGLTGFCMFLFTERSRPLTAGLFLSITLIKPHLLYLLYLTILLSATTAKGRSILYGMLLGTMTMLLGILLINASIIDWYIQFAMQPPIFWLTPTLGTFFQSFSGIHSNTIRFLPSILTLSFFCLWWFYCKTENIRALEDSKFIFFILPLSFCTAPYGWLFDMLLLCPVILHITLECSLSSKQRTLNICTLLSIHSLCLLISFFDLSMEWYVFYPISIMLLMVYLRIRSRFDAIQ